MKKVSLLFIVYFLTQLHCFSQIAVTTNSVATTLAQNIVGNGVTITNANLICPNGASGIFTVSGPASALGIPSGVILTTGSAVSAAAGSISFASVDNATTYSDPALTSISSTATNDACILTFDFVPLCNTVDIKFVFGSEEYPSFVGSINDGFGIFLSGPNPGGGTYSNYDFAILPNGTQITINNVNSGSNSSYYHDNSSGTMSNYLAYGGYTSVITASVAVTPCQTYSMEVGIADAGDHVYDSGVFIQENSISCTNTPTVTTSVTAANCGNTGSATATVTNYTATPTYQWLPGNATTASITNIAAGTYTCLVGLQSGCGINTQTVTAVVPSTGSTFNFTTNLQNPLCNNGANGSVGVSITGGTSPYTYTWTTTPPQNTATTTATLPAGTYTLNMTDNAGCAGTTTVTLVNPPAVVATVTTSPTTCSAAIGVATASITSGGTAPYTYTWSNTQQTQTINGLMSGTYSVLISDVNTCTATASGTVGMQGFTWTLSGASTNPKCLNSTDGTATVTITNPGANTFTYSWNTSPVQTNSVATTLSANTYVATVTDNNGCSSTASVTLVNPAPITATVNTTPTICTGSVGSATVNVLSGGLAPFNYTWLTNPAQSGATAGNLSQATYSVVITDANGCPLIDTGTVHSTGFTWIPVAVSSQTKCFNSTDGTATVNITNPGNSTFNSYLWMPGAQTGNTASNLAAGNYTVTVTDNLGCISTASVTITKPTQMVASTQSTPAFCTSANGNAHVSISGGTQPYQSYSWSVTNPIQTTQTATGLTQGQYTVLVTDANSCTKTATVIVGDTTDLNVTVSQSPDLCSQGVGKATANPTGQSPYTFVWSTTPAQSTQTADSLTSGTYSVNVIDAYGCTASAAITVVNQNDVLVPQFITTPQGEIDAENPIALTISANNGWNVSSAFLTDSAAIIKIPITSNPFNYVFPKYGNYTATYYYTSINGCMDTVTEYITVKDYITLYIPNAFTPNGDGINDTFEAAGTFVTHFEMYIYDRWGILVTKLDNIHKVWDGSKNGGNAATDTYVYKGTAYDIFGKHVDFHGQVNLIR